MDYIRSSSYHFSKNKKNIQLFDAPDKFTNDFKKLGGRYYIKRGMWSFQASILDDSQKETDTSAIEEEEEEEEVNGEESAMEEEAEEEVENGEESAMEEEEVENGEESAMEEEVEEEVENGEESAMEEEEEIIEQITVDAMEEEEEEEVIEQITVDGMEQEEVQAEESNTYLSEDCSIVEPNEYTNYHSVITIDHNDRMQEAATTHAIDIEEEVIELDGDIEDDEEDSVVELENVDYYNNIDSNLNLTANQTKSHYVIDIINDDYVANSHKVAHTPTIHERDRISKEDALYINETLVRSTNKYKIYPSDQFYDIIANYKKLVQLKEK